MEQKCINCGNGKWCDGVTPIAETCTKCHYVVKGALVPQPSNWKPKEQTNADRIREMSDEELVEHFGRSMDGAKFCTGICNDQNDCNLCRLAWLKQPAEEAD